MTEGGAGENMKDQVPYFSHDSNARTDPRIIAMRSVYKAEGYGWYWMLIEILREQDNYRLPITKYTYDSLALQMQADGNDIERFVNDCINEFTDEKGSLLKTDGKSIWSNSLLARMEIKTYNSEVKRGNAGKRWDKSGENEKNKEAGKKFVPPKLEEVQAYCKERNNNVDPVKWHNHYTSNGWKVGRVPMKDWEAAVRTWERNSYETHSAQDDNSKDRLSYYLGQGRTEA